MLFKFILYIAIFYFVFKFVSRLFLPSGSRKKNKRGSFYINFDKFNQSGGNGRPTGQSDSRKNLDDIEEAEYEEIVDKDQKSST